MFAKQPIAGILLLVLVNSISAEYDVDGVCTLVSSGTRIGSIESCQKYYVCNNGKATAYDCPSGTKFSKNSQTCLSAASVSCYFGDTSPCASKTEGFVPKSGSCNGWIYCKNGKEVGSGICASNFIFKDGECRYGECPVAAANVDASFTSICQVLPNNKYFGSTKDCGKWQTCKNELLTGGFCDNTFVFDVESGSCIYENTNTCNRVTGVSIQPDIETFGQCITDAAIKTTDTCSDYLKCENKLWTLKSCATNYFFDTTKSTCVPRKAAVTVDCNRCQYSKKQFVNAVDPECRKYLLCENGVKKGASFCNVGYFFDESSQACVKGSGANYVLNNGACYSSPNPIP